MTTIQPGPARRRIATIALLVFVAGSLAACGTGSTTSGSAQLSAAQYRARLAALSQREDRAQKSVARAMHARSVAEIQSLLTRFAADQQAVGDELASLNPPNNALAANAELARGFHDSAGALRPIIAKLRSVSSPKAALALTNRISPQSGREIDAALGKLKKEGYTKGS